MARAQMRPKYTGRLWVEPYLAMIWLLAYPREYPEDFVVTTNAG